jgi:hypothetical protein
MRVAVGWPLSNMFKMVPLILSTSAFVLHNMALFAHAGGSFRHGKVNSIELCMLLVVATKLGTGVMSVQATVLVVDPSFVGIVAVMSIVRFGHVSLPKLSTHCAYSGSCLSR